MNTKHILSSITLSLGLLGTTATWAQDAVKPATPTEQSQAQTERAERHHKKLNAEQIQDIGPIYEQLKKAGYPKVGSIKQGHRGVVATVVNTEGQVVRLKQESGKNEFTVLEHKKEGKHSNRRHRGEKTEHTAKPAEQNT